MRRLVVSALTLEVDGTPVRAQLAATSFPDAEAMRRGEGTIRLQSTATLPRLSTGRHQLLFRNRHHPDRSVYLANALVPASNDSCGHGAAARRRSDGADDRLRRCALAPATSTAAWLLGSLAAAMVVVLGIRRSRSATVKKAWQPNLREDLP